MDHPRSRGVYPEKMDRMRCGRGSSPLARGLLPAFSLPNSPSGSSPLARGLLAGPGDGPGYRGIIPARAGFTRDACLRK